MASISTLLLSLRFGLRLPYLIVRLIIELNITVLSQASLTQELSLLFQNILDRDTLVREYLEMIANQMSILTPLTRNERGAKMIGLLRDAMGRAIQALATCEC